MAGKKQAAKVPATQRPTLGQLRDLNTDLSYINSHLEGENTRLGYELGTAKLRAQHLSAHLAHAAHLLGVASEGLSALGAHQTAQLAHVAATKYKTDVDPDGVALRDKLGLPF